MIHKKRIISLLSLGVFVLALVLVPGAVWARDKDGDGFHKPADCDDGDFTVNPGAVEICDEKDNDCNGIVDDTLQPCADCIDEDFDNYYSEDSIGDCGILVDCDDSNPKIYPGATELCNDGIDNNCDLLVDEQDVNCVNCSLYDNDKDGYFAVTGCGTPVDCNDEDLTIYPGAPELCDGIDNQCKDDPGYNFTDEGCTACADEDEDGYFTTSGCGSLEVDCDDSDIDVNQGATEDCGIDGYGNGIDDNCNDQKDEGCQVADGDSDGDGLSDLAESAGFLLSNEFDSWWNGSVWVSAAEMIPSAALNPNIQDLFVIWRPLSTGSRVDLEDCNIFQFASNPISIGGAERQVWILKEKPNAISASRLIASDVVSDQKAAVLIESSELGGTAVGLSQPGTIMTEGKGNAWIKTHKIELNINTNCPSDYSCELDGEEYLNADLMCINKKI